MAKPENSYSATTESIVLQSVFDLLLSQEKDTVPEAANNAELVRHDWDQLDPRRRLLYARVVAAMFPNDLSGQERASQAVLLLLRFEKEVADTLQLNAAVGLGPIATGNTAEVV